MAGKSLDEIFGAVPSAALPPSAGLAASAATQPTIETAPQEAPSGGNNGDSPETAVRSSPLAIIERAALGWQRTPEKQKLWLQRNFGKDNVAVVKQDEDSVGFSVKDKQGKWYQVDPSGMSLFSLKELGVDAKDLVGDVAEFVGKNGLKSIGALKGFAMGAAAAAPEGAITGSVAGPAGAVAGAGMAGLAGGIVGAMAGGAAGAVTEEALHLGDKPSDYLEQAKAGMLFGLEQEAGGRAFGFGLNKATDAVAGIVKRIGVGPTGKALRASVISAISGIQEPLARVWADVPDKVKYFQDVAINDVKNGTKELQRIQKRIVDQFVDTSVSANAKMNSAYAPIKENLNKVSVPMKQVIDNAEVSLADAFNPLIESSYLNADGSLASKSINKATRSVDGVERKALSRLSQDLQTIKNITEKGGSQSYKEAQIFIDNVEKYMTYGTNKVDDEPLRRAITQVRNNMKTFVDNAAAKADQKSYTELKTLDAKYGPVKDLINEVKNLSQDNRVDGFLKAIKRDDGSYKSELLGNLSELAGVKNPTQDILATQAADATKSWFIPGRNFSKYFQGSPRAGAAFAKGVGAADELIKPVQSTAEQVSEAVLPYARTAFRQLRNLDHSTYRTIVQDPRAVQGISDIIMGGALTERNTRKQLVNTANEETKQ